MNTLKLAATISTSISWRDELAYFHGEKSEGFERLKEAIKMVRSPNSHTDSALSEGTGVERVRSAGAGA
jgi:hypothetical protein